jgi:hypothetical protein
MVEAQALLPLRVADEYRLTEQLADVETGRHRSTRDLQRFLDGADDVERRDVAVLDHARQDRAQPVLSDDVLLHGKAVADVADILDEDHRAVDVVWASISLMPLTLELIEYSL